MRRKVVKKSNAPKCSILVETLSLTLYLTLMNEPSNVRTNYNFSVVRWLLKLKILFEYYSIVMSLNCNTIYATFKFINSIMKK